MELRAVTLADSEGDPTRLVGVAASEGLPDVLEKQPHETLWAAVERAEEGPHTRA